MGHEKIKYDNLNLYRKEQLSFSNKNKIVFYLNIKKLNKYIFIY